MNALQVYQPPNVPQIYQRYQPPRLAPDLQAAVDRHLAGSVFFPGDPGSDDPGFRMPPDPLAFHPDAAAMAAAHRAAFELRADRQTIVHWLEFIALCVQPTPSAQQIEAASVALCKLCRDLPAAVWNEDTEIEAGAKLKIWPPLAEIKELLKPHANKLERQMRTLERMARAPVAHFHGEPPAPYVIPPLPDWVTGPSIRARKPAEPRKSRAVEPERTVEEQLAHWPSFVRPPEWKAQPKAERAEQQAAA